jgi:hypothetical protein
MRWSEKLASVLAIQDYSAVPWQNKFAVWTKSP